MARTVETSIRWRDGLVFAGGPAGRANAVMDGESKEAPSPVETLVLSAAACAATDVVLILQKMRVGLRGLAVDARAERRDAEPRRLTALNLTFRVTADAVDDAQARRAVALSLEKYCSVVASLAPDIAVTADVVLD